MEKKDRRFQMTEQLIRETYRRMLSEIPVDKITVAELCRRAEINRGTFYLHYKDCYELLERMGEELAEDLSESMSGLFQSGDHLRMGVRTTLKALFRDEGASHILFSNDRAKCFDRISASSREETVQSWMARSELSRAQAEMIYAFISGGCYSVARDIYTGTLRGQGEDSYEVLFQLISEGLNAFVSKIE